MAYEEYPRHLHKAGGVHTVVHNDEEKAAALAAGYALAPVLDEVPSAAAAEAEQAPDAEPVADAPKKAKKPRKPKADPRA